jgi:hypothetical protein
MHVMLEAMRLRVGDRPHHVGDAPSSRASAIKKETRLPAWDTPLLCAIDRIEHTQVEDARHQAATHENHERISRQEGDPPSGGRSSKCRASSSRETHSGRRRTTKSLPSDRRQASRIHSTLADSAFDDHETPERGCSHREAAGRTPRVLGLELPPKDPRRNPLISLASTGARRRLPTESSLLPHTNSMPALVEISGPTFSEETNIETPGPIGKAAGDRENKWDIPGTSPSFIAIAEPIRSHILTHMVTYTIEQSLIFPASQATMSGRQRSRRPR